MGEVEKLPASAVNEWRAYLNGWPSGEEAMDLRFEVLRRDVVEGFNNLHYLTGIVGGVRPKPILPTPKTMADVKIFDRIGEEQRKKGGGKYFDEMTPEEVARRMRAFDISMKATKKKKGQ